MFRRPALGVRFNPFGLQEPQSFDEIKNAAPYGLRHHLVAEQARVGLSEFSAEPHAGVIPLDESKDLQADESIYVPDSENPFAAPAREEHDFVSMEQIKTNFGATRLFTDFAQEMADYDHVIQKGGLLLPAVALSAGAIALGGSSNIIPLFAGGVGLGLLTSVMPGLLILRNRYISKQFEKAVFQAHGNDNMQRLIMSAALMSPYFETTRLRLKYDSTFRNYGISAYDRDEIVASLDGAKIQLDEAVAKLKESGLNLSDWLNWRDY